MDLFGTNYTDNSVFRLLGLHSSDATHFPDMTSTWYTTNDATLEFTGVQLEVGSVATDFEHRSFGQELLACERYFQKAKGYVGASNGHWISLRPTMRATPTATVNSGTLASVNQITVNSSNWNAHGLSAEVREVFYNAEL